MAIGREGDPERPDSEVARWTATTAGFVAGLGLGALQPLVVVGFGVGISAGLSPVGLVFIGCVGVVLTVGPVAVLVRGGRNATVPIALASLFLAFGMLAGNLVVVRLQIGFAAPRPPSEIHPTGSGWSAAGHLVDGRSDHTATLLADGRVLVAGGRDRSVVLASAELYDPLTETWRKTGLMSSGRADHDATLLADGRVLVVDGSGAAVLFDPVTEQWTVTSSLATGRAAFAIVSLIDGRALVIGGWISDASSLPEGPSGSAELYDSASGAWSPVGPMTVSRAEHSATRLADGRILVVGGWGRSSSANDPRPALASAEIFDPATNTWTNVSSMRDARSGHGAVLEVAGTVVVVGGRPEAVTAERFDPMTGTWSQAAPVELLLGPTALRARDDGLVFVDGLGAVAKLDPGDAAGRVVGNTEHGFGATATRLADGRILVVGGSRYGRADPLADVHLFDPG
ncbi:MAG: kelch repeat-containing protein [Chloroflexota bacterium]